MSENPINPRTAVRVCCSTGPWVSTTCNPTDRPTGIPGQTTENGAVFRSIPRKFAKRGVFSSVRCHRNRWCASWNQIGQILDWVTIWWIWLGSSKTKISEVQVDILKMQNLEICRKISIPVVNTIIAVLGGSLLSWISVTITGRCGSNNKPRAAVRACPHG